jgi:hypothetical protein
MMVNESTQVPLQFTAATDGDEPAPHGFQCGAKLRAEILSWRVGLGRRDGRRRRALAAAGQSLANPVEEGVVDADVGQPRSSSRQI